MTYRQAARDLLRLQWLAAMTDAVTVSRVTDRGALQPDGTYLPTTLTVYTGPASVRPATGGQPADVVFGGSVEVIDRYVVDLPHTVVDVRTEDEVTVTASEDPDLVGLVLTVIGVRGSGVAATHRHVIAERRQRETV